MNVKDERSQAIDWWLISYADIEAIEKLLDGIRGEGKENARKVFDILQMGLHISENPPLDFQIQDERKDEHDRK